MTYRILVATRSSGSTSPRPWDVLAQSNCEVVRADMSLKMTEERLIEALEGSGGTIIRLDLFSRLDKSFTDSPAIQQNHPYRSQGSGLCRHNNHD